MTSDDTDAVARVFANEVPEIAAGIIEIKSIARKVGYRSKLALLSTDPRVDCIGACIGVRGRRIKAIGEALCGEKVDLVLWDDSPEQLIANTLRPAKLQSIVLLPAERRAVVALDMEQLFLIVAIGSENLLLASELTGWHIEVGM